MRRFTSVICVAAACALLVWPGSARAEDVTLQFLYTQPTPTWGPVIAEFEKRNPGIHVAGQQVPFDALNAQVTARIGAHDSSIDVFGCDEPRVPAFARRGYLLDLSDLRPDFENAVSQKAIGAVSADNKLWSFPLWTSTQVMFYNKDLLAKAALPMPSADPKARMTWEALLEQAAKAQQAGAKWGFTFDQVDRYYELEPLYVSSGAGLGLGGENMLSAPSRYACLGTDDGLVWQAVLERHCPARHTAGADSPAVRVRADGVHGRRPLEPGVADAGEGLVVRHGGDALLRWRQAGHSDRLLVDRGQPL